MSLFKDTSPVCLQPLHIVYRSSKILCHASSAGEIKSQKARIPTLSMPTEGHSVAGVTAFRKVLHVLQPNLCASKPTMLEEEGRLRRIYGSGWKRGEQF
jgi:hypothetical protein